MTNRALFFLLMFAVGIADAQIVEPAGTNAGGRVIEGRIVAADGKPIPGAKVLFGEDSRGMALVEGATATTDAQGRYRADLVKYPWSTATIRTLVLAPGFKARDGKTEPGSVAATADFELVAESWKETLVRMEDSAGRPVAGAEIKCLVGMVAWASFKTDALGCCRIAMARNFGMSLSTTPRNARPIEAYFSGAKDDPPSVTLPVLPPIRGRVIDPEGRPVPDAAVGRWLTFDSDGTGEMLRFFGGSIALTDRNGKFVIAPTLHLRFYMWRPAPKLEALCFAAPSFRSEGWLLFRPNQPVRTSYQLFDPSRPVEPMTVTLKPSRRVRIPISRAFVTSKRKTQYDSEILINPRKDVPNWVFFLSNRTTKPTGESPTQAAGPAWFDRDSGATVRS